MLLISTLQIMSVNLAFISRLFSFQSLKKFAASQPLLHYFFPFHKTSFQYSSITSHCLRLGRAEMNSAGFDYCEKMYYCQGNWGKHKFLRYFFSVQQCSRSVKKDELFYNLEEHVKQNVLQLNKSFYLQGLGIPQGSVLSSLLCSLYYGHMDRKLIFPFLEKTSEPVQIFSRQPNSQDASAIENSKHKTASSCSYMLLRFIDDFLFMSTSRDQAENFFRMLRTGFPDYNCYMNENKFCINFDIEISGQPSNRVCVGEDGISFLRWSGLLINCCTLEVQADYTRLIFLAVIIQLMIFQSVNIVQSTYLQMCCLEPGTYYNKILLVLLTSLWNLLIYKLGLVF